MSDSEVARLKASRNSIAELKLKLINLRSEYPTGPVFVFEGVDDRALYETWIGKISGAPKFEPFSCNGKGKLLQFREMLERDVAGLRKDCYYFLDRDFDEIAKLRRDDVTFVTEGYSIENYLVNSEAIDSILRVIFHCDGMVSVRQRLTEIFEADYDQFLDVTREHNYRIFLVTRLGFQFDAHFPKSVGKLADVDIEGVRKSAISADTLIRCQGDLTATPELEDEFKNLNPRMDFHGKFAYFFLEAWLQRLAIDRVAAGSQYFGNNRCTAKPAVSSISVGLLASWVRPPIELINFIGRHFSVK